MTVPLIKLHHITIGYGKRPLLPPLDLTLDRGTFLGIVGPNGSGKTTLVCTLLGLLPPLSGYISYANNRPPRFGYVPQHTDWDPALPMTTLDMVLMGRFSRIGLLHRARPSDREAVLQALQQVNLVDVAMQPVQTLSGGQLRRALIARALASGPDILVLDEPTSGMDLVAEQSLLALIQAWHRRWHWGVIFISHQLSVVADVASEVLLLDRDRGRVEHGPVREVITTARLSTLYGTQVRVEKIMGHWVTSVSLPPSD